MFKRICSIDAKEEKAKSTDYLLITSEDLKKYRVKPWHNVQNYAYNFCNSSRPIIASAIASKLIPHLVCPYSIVTKINHDKIENGKEFFGLQQLDNGRDFELGLDQFNRNEDLAKIVVFDTLLFFNDRSNKNLNLYCSADNLHMIDLDNFFSFDRSKYNYSPKEYWKFLLEKHPLTRFIKETNFDSKSFINDFMNLPQSWIDSMLSNVPSEWSEKGGGEDIKQQISISRKHGEELFNLIESVHG